jgi:hypothetical protein
MGKLSQGVSKRARLRSGVIAENSRVVSSWVRRTGRGKAARFSRELLLAVVRGA